MVSYTDFDWARFNGLVRRSRLPHVALHLEVSTRNWPNTTDLRFQARNEAHAMVTHLTELCRYLRDHLEVPLLLENMATWAGS